MVCQTAGAQQTQTNRRQPVFSTISLHRMLTCNMLLKTISITTSVIITLSIVIRTSTHLQVTCRARLYPISWHTIRFPIISYRMPSTCNRATYPRYSCNVIIARYRLRLAVRVWPRYDSKRVSTVLPWAAFDNRSGFSFSFSSI